MQEQYRVQEEPAQVSFDAQHYQRALEHLVKVIQDISLAREISAIARIVSDAVRAFTGAEGAVFVLREGDECYYLDEPILQPAWKGKRFPMSACLSGWVIQNRSACVIEDVSVDPRVPTKAYAGTAIKSLALVPLRSADPLGAMGAYWTHPHHMPTAQMRLLQALADATAVAMENIRMHHSLEQRVRERTAELEAAHQRLQHEMAERERVEAEMRKLAVTDSHTGLVNRRGFFQEARQKLDLAHRHGLGWSLLFVDVDGLKHVNDTYGHKAGDALVAGAATVLRDTFRQSDVVGRIGGDEFAVLAVDGGDAAVTRARVEHAVAEFNQSAGLEFQLSLSLGVVPCGGACGTDLEELLGRADAHMYRAKRAKHALRPRPLGRAQRRPLQSEALHQ